MEINAFLVLHQLFTLSLNGIKYHTIGFNGKVVIDVTDHIKIINKYILTHDQSKYVTLW